MPGWSASYRPKVRAEVATESLRGVVFLAGPWGSIRRGGVPGNPGCEARELRDCILAVSLTRWGTLGSDLASESHFPPHHHGDNSLSVAVKIRCDAVGKGHCMLFSGLSSFLVFVEDRRHRY